MTQLKIDFQNDAGKMAWSEELEGVPLKQRLKLILANSRVSVDSYSNSETIGNGGIQAVKSEPGMSDEVLDELDHVVLKERLRRLLQGKCSGLSSSSLEESSPEAVRAKLSCGGQRQAVVGNLMHGSDRTCTSGTSNGTFNPSSKPQALSRCSKTSRQFSSDSLRIKRNEADSGKTLQSDDIRTPKTSAVPKLANIKTEPLRYEFQNSNETMLGQTTQISSMNFVPVKNEYQNTGNACEDEDELDHMLLRERMKLFSSRNSPSVDINRSSECTDKMPPPSAVSRPVETKIAELLKTNRPRKRRKTVTDSVETAMDEDAPGLLQLLVVRGVSINEIKLYDEPEMTDDLDVSSLKDSFSELEQVFTKLFSQRDSFLKLGPLRCMKEEKANYCLECLFSLIEQARYLQFRDWPVEWGWCRDIQSFIFVFEKHNRMVLERPEYGYATYFFELENSLPIGWQIRRLVIAMKFTNCSRVTIIENKALVVGEDLTEGEAKVLSEYGWRPNTGLGSMLNYYERVVHDRKNEKDGSEWRLKIGKLLMEGYNGGSLIPTAIPVKVMEYNAEHPVPVKLEVD